MKIMKRKKISVIFVVISIKNKKMLVNKCVVRDIKNYIYLYYKAFSCVLGHCLFVVNVNKFFFF